MIFKNPFVLLILGAWFAFAATLARRGLSWQIKTYLAATFALAAFGLSLVHITEFMSILNVAGAAILGLFAIAVLFGVVEFALLPLLGQFRLGAISRITYYEALLQPFTLIVLSVGLIAIGIAAGLQYFTYNEDFKMYRDVATSFVFLFTLPIMIFASTKVVDEEIENRTMLTLMSKPVSRWQVILGKYLGVMLLILAAVVTLSIMVGVCGYVRYFDDMRIDYQLAAPQERLELDFANHKALLAILPSMTLAFLQVAALAAISVAVSTRFGLAANVTVVVLIYIAANLAQYIRTTSDLPAVVHAVAILLTYLLPGLSLLDLNQRLVFGNYLYGKTDWALEAGIPLPSYSQIWAYVGMAAVYTLFYVAAALSLGMALFRSRELT
jgi:ABC-type transport system involved in multi-copper enzyme maturation permease subunit